MQRPNDVNLDRAGLPKVGELRVNGNPPIALAECPDCPAWMPTENIYWSLRRGWVCTSCSDDGHWSLEQELLFRANRAPQIKCEGCGEG